MFCALHNYAPLMFCQDAVLAAEAGVDGIIVSNHGGEFSEPASAFRTVDADLRDVRSSDGIVSAHPISVERFVKPPSQLYAFDRGPIQNPQATS